MYSITQSPSVAVNLAHAIQDENIRRVGPAPRASKRLSGRPDWTWLAWPALHWTQRPASAV